MQLHRIIGRMLLHLPQDLIEFTWRKFSNVMLSAKMAERYVPQYLPKSSVKVIGQRLKAIQLEAIEHQAIKHQAIEHQAIEQHAIKHPFVKPPRPQASMTLQDEQTVKWIRNKTAEANRNNLKRTQAYYEFYRNFPEVHWAFLAHMVSRNGGWNMTDLKGDLLPRIMDSGQTNHLFRFLERANALIFHDAYPQLLLYAESRRVNRNLFHLLSSFDVSQFMRVVWDYFWQNRRHSPLLTVALIINEQNYIEKRVVQDSLFKKNVIETLLFQIQASMQLTQVIFPYSPVKLAGLTLEDFSDLDERIEFGKKLYTILFGFPEILGGAQSFAARTKHSGSRADYWPQLFTKIKTSAPSSAYTKKLKGFQLSEGVSGFYSPELAQAWKDHPIDHIDHYDWCVDRSCLSYLKNPSPPFSVEMEEEHCLSLNVVEYYILAKS